MGYTQYHEGATLKSIIREHTSGWDSLSADGSGVRRVCRVITKAFVGNRRFKGNLWVVRQDHIIEPGGHVQWYPPYIVVYILDCSGKKWGYRDYDESCHPYHYNCPLKYLLMCPEENREWREQVRLHHKENPRKHPRPRRKRQTLEATRPRDGGDYAGPDFDRDAWAQRPRDPSVADTLGL